METKHTPGPWFEIVNRGVEGIGAGADTTDGDYFFDGERICEFTTINPRNAANARLIAAAPELLEALVWREQFERRAGEDSNDLFERVAANFRRETGFLRPGKDCRVHSYEERQDAWEAWMEAGRARVRAAIAKATESTA